MCTYVWFLLVCLVLCLMSDSNDKIFNLASDGRAVKQQLKANFVPQSISDMMCTCVFFQPLQDQSIPWSCWFRGSSANKSTNQSINQSISQSINQSISDTHVRLSSFSLFWLDNIDWFYYSKTPLVENFISIFYNTGQAHYALTQFPVLRGRGWNCIHQQAASRTLVPPPHAAAANTARKCHWEWPHHWAGKS